ncbi:right-handed parallel beta-helix repeat-containing protein [Methylomonas sp. 2BW1-5-20]|uniref:right-handed parallel beta-helix repeat-containing protein n=1 Tax=Methylomonas sp. 2BW1-5-20 TaxID=3376686 RepID=UPI00404C735C
MKSVDLARNQAIYQSPNYAMGVYLDDGASGFTVNDNIFENAGAVSLHIHGGRDNKIYNNYFKTNGAAIWVSQFAPTYDLNQNQTKLESSAYKTPLWKQKYPELAIPMQNKAWPEGNLIERNIIVTGKSDGPSFRYFLPKTSSIIRKNLIWSTNGPLAVDYNISEQNQKTPGATWPDWVAQGIDKDSIIADPCLAIVNKRLVACAGSPIKDIGFETIPSDIGIVQ